MGVQGHCDALLEGGRVSDEHIFPDHAHAVRLNHNAATRTNSRVTSEEISLDDRRGVILAVYAPTLFGGVVLLKDVVNDNRI
jgi:hypothetical protein